MSNQLVAGMIAGASGYAAFGVMRLTAVFAEGDLSVFTKLGEYGVSGLLMSVIVYIVYLLLNKTLQSRETDLAWHREELSKKAALFEKTIELQGNLSLEKQNYVVDKLTNVMEKIETKLAHRAEDMVKLMETVRAANETLEDVKNVLGACHEVHKIQTKLSLRETKHKGESTES